MIRALLQASTLLLVSVAPLAASQSPTSSPTRKAAAEDQKVQASTSTTPKRSTRIKRSSAKFEEIKLSTEDNLTLLGSFYPPKSKSQRRPGVLIVHDAGGDRSQLDSLASSLQKRNIGVLTVDIRGHGLSVCEDMDWSKLEDTEKDRLWTFAMRDIAAGMKYLRNRKEIHSSTMAVVGMGAGCALATRQAGRDEYVRAVVMIEPCGAQYGFDLPRDIGELDGLPTLIVSEKDTRTSAERLREAGHRASGGDEYIEVSILKPTGESVLENKRLNSTVTTFVQGVLMPKKGR